MKKKPVVISPVISVPKPNIQTLGVIITGKTPLIYHKWSEKAKTQIRDKQAGKAKGQVRGKRDPEQEYKDSFYYNSDGDIAFPAGSIKMAIVGAARSLDKVNMTNIRAAVFVVGDDDNLIKVDYKEKVMREDMVRVGRGSADMRYRGELRGWSMTFDIEYNGDVFSAEEVSNLLETAGFSQGLGEWRPERDGNYGKFTCIG